MSKIYSPEEVAKAVLKRCQELAQQSKMTKKEDCEEVAEEKVKEHEKKCTKKKKQTWKKKWTLSKRPKNTKKK